MENHQVVLVVVDEFGQVVLVLLDDTIANQYA